MNYCLQKADVFSQGAHAAAEGDDEHEEAHDHQHDSGVHRQTCKCCLWKKKGREEVLKDLRETVCCTPTPPNVSSPTVTWQRAFIHNAALAFNFHHEIRNTHTWTLSRPSVFDGRQQDCPDVQCSHYQRGGETERLLTGMFHQAREHADGHHHQGTYLKDKRGKIRRKHTQHRRRTI